MVHKFLSPARLGLGVAALAASLLTGCVAVTAPPAPPAPCAPDDIAYVGTDGSQLRALRFDACAGTLAMIGPVADVAKPRWTVSYPTKPAAKPAVYAALDAGSVAAFAVDRSTAALTPLGESSAGGSGTTHLYFDAPSRMLLAANFGAGAVSSLPVKGDGSLGPLVSTIKSTGSGPHRRQASAHAHGLAVSPDGRFAMVADMGADRVFIYPLDRATHVLKGDDAGRSFATPPGSGPRRAIFGRDGRFVYVLAELSAEISTLRWDAAQGRLTQLQTLPVSTPEFTGAKSTSEIALSPDGRFLYVGNRGENLLTVYAIDAASGELSLVQRLPSGGDGLWHFDLHASGQWLLVANYRSNRINLFGVDPGTGLLTDTGRSVESPAPVSVAFLH
jgi:6-phosphogluconolactonase